MVLKYFQKPTPEELVRKWRKDITTQKRLLDRQIRSIDVEEAKAKRSLKVLAKKRDETSCKILAKELVRSHKQKARLHTSKAQLNSIGMEMERQAAMLKVVGTLTKSTEVMRMVNNLVKIQQISGAVQEMSQEMMKAGIISEMMDDTFEVMDDVDVDDEAEDEVNKILYEVTEGLLGEAGAVGPTLE
ncbi:Vacuolar protein-sorting-associated protein 24, partial [Dimargaris verticillata]